MYISIGGTASCCGIPSTKSHFHSVDQQLGSDGGLHGMEPVH